jgi:branched-subunit amino acid aminotransferase/4-amino-4-deoxychorismate lyase
VTNKVSPIKIQLQEDLPNLPDKNGYFESFLGNFEQNILTFQFLDRHFLRLSKSINRQKNQIAEIFIETIKNHFFDKLKIFDQQKQNSIKLFRFRLWSNGLDFILDIAPFKSRFNPVISNEQITAKLVIMNESRDKSGKYTPALESINSFNYAKQNGFDEALLINKDNLVTESSWCNFYYVIDGIVFLSGLGLNGIAQEVLTDLIIDKSKIKVKAITISELLENKYPCFLTNAIYGVIPISQIDNVNFSSDSLIDKIKLDFNKLKNSTIETIWIQINS